MPRDTTPKRHAVPDSQLDTWGDNIRDRRAARNMTQLELARAMGVSQPTVWRWEHGKNAPSDADRVLLAEILGGEVGVMFLLTTGLLNAVPETV